MNDQSLDYLPQRGGVGGILPVVSVLVTELELRSLWVTREQGWAFGVMQHPALISRLAGQKYAMHPPCAGELGAPTGERTPMPTRSQRLALFTCKDLRGGWNSLSSRPGTTT